MNNLPYCNTRDYNSIDRILIVLLIMLSSIAFRRIIVVLLVALGLTSTAAESSLLLGNTRGQSEIFQYGLESGEMVPFVPGGILEAPDHILEYEGYYYISTGAEVNTSSIARLPVKSKSAADDIEVRFASGGGLKRPYGFDIYDDTLYVASFMTDQILTYSLTSGDYIGIFAQGNGTEEGLCNGPNQIFIYQGNLYMTTQGSFVDASTGTLNYGLASQTVVYDLETGQGNVFIPQPDPDPLGMGFISMLGLKIGCGADSLLEDDCTVYTTDFAGGLRLYAFSTQELIDSQSTTYADGAATGSMALADDGTIYTCGFSSEENGAILSLQPDTDPTSNGTLSIVYSEESELLARPIGLFYISDDEGSVMVEEDMGTATDEGTSGSTRRVGNLALLAWFSYSLAHF